MVYARSAASTPRQWLAPEQSNGMTGNMKLDIPAAGFGQPVEEDDDASHQHKGAPRTPQTAAREAALDAAAGTTRDPAGCHHVTMAHGVDVCLPACMERAV